MVSQYISKETEVIFRETWNILRETRDLTNLAPSSQNAWGPIEKVTGIQAATSAAT